MTQMTRKIDALVAEYIMGYKNNNLTEMCVNPMWAWESGGQFKQMLFPKYSTDISAAWEVFEHLKAKKPEGTDYGSGTWTIDSLDTGYDVYYKHLSINDYEYTFCDTYAINAPLAICQAALKAKGVSQKLIDEALLPPV